MRALDIRTYVRYDGGMSATTVELELPLGGTEASSLAQRRLSHLAQAAELDPQLLLRLIRAFPSLRAIYSAGEADLAAVIGPVAAARLSWFLDAPLATGLAPSELGHLSRAA